MWRSRRGSAIVRSMLVCALCAPWIAAGPATGAPATAVAASTSGETGASLAPSPARTAQVAVHVSGYTDALHGSPGTAAPASDPLGWYYDSFMHFQVRGMLEEALRGDGTPFVEVTDADVEAGALLDGGRPRYPIVFSVMTEAASDAEVAEFDRYVAAGGFVYGAGSSWARRPDGSWRVDGSGLAQPGLLGRAGLTSLSAASRPGGGTWGWTLTKSVRRTSDRAMVSHLPDGLDIVWPGPARFDTDAHALLYSAGWPHPAWAARAVTSGGAEVLATMPAPTGTGSEPAVFLATRASGRGRWLWASEMAPLAGWGGCAPDTSEYVFVRRAIEWAFETQGMPLVRGAAWPYPYRAAVQTRWDMDFYPGDIRGLVPIETAHGVAGQYFVVTNLASVDGGNWVTWAAGQGAVIGSHCATHAGPDALSPQEAASNLETSLDTLRAWTGQRPTDFVAPAYQAIKDSSFGIEDAKGIVTAGEQNFGPFPHYSLSMLEPGTHFPQLQVPTSEWLSAASASSPDARSRMELISETSLVQAVDFYYGLGALINVYGHPYSSNRTRLQAYLDAASRPDVWKTTSGAIAAWWSHRDAVALSPVVTQDEATVTVTVGLAGAADPNAAVDVTPPGFSASEAEGLEVLVDGVPTADYVVAGYGIKVRAGSASLVTLRYRAPADVTPPSPPTGLAVTDTGEGGALSISWNEPAETDFDHARVYRSASATETPELVADDAFSPFVDRSVTDGVTYYYSVRSVDRSGNESLPSAVVTGSSSGRQSSLDFDADDAVVVANAAALDATGALTVEAFVKVRRMPSRKGAAIVSRVDGTDRSWELYYDDKGRVYFYARRPNDSGYTQVSSPQRTLEVGAWYHVAGVVDPVAKTLSVYVGGVRRASTSYAYEGARAGDGRIGINAEPSGTGAAVVGDAFIDEVRVSRQARYAGTSYPVPVERFSADANTALLYHFDEGAGTSVLDDSGRDNRAAFVGDPAWAQGYALRHPTAPPPPPPPPPPDTTPPAAPDAVNVAALTGALRVSWNDPADTDFAHDHVYRSSTEGTLGALVGDDVVGRSYTDAAVLPGTTYYYTVRSVDASGNESANVDQHPGSLPVLGSTFALRLDSTGDLVVVADSESLDATGPMTVEAWVRPDLMPAAGKYGIVASRWEGAETCWSLYYGSDGRVYFLVRDDTGVQTQAISPIGSLLPSTWSHVAGVIDPVGHQLRLYVNGSRVTYKAFAGTGARASAARLGINGNVSGAGGMNLGDATFDDVRLSAASRYSGAAVAVPAVPLAVDAATRALWRFDEGSGAVAVDSGPFGTTGMVLGDPEWEAK